jgi:hypothetical protein
MRNIFFDTKAKFENKQFIKKVMSHDSVVANIVVKFLEQPIYILNYGGQMNDSQIGYFEDIMKDVYSRFAMFIYDNYDNGYYDDENNYSDNDLIRKIADHFNEYISVVNITTDHERNDPKLFETDEWRSLLIEALETDLCMYGDIKVDRITQMTIYKTNIKSGKITLLTKDEVIELLRQ